MALTGNKGEGSEVYVMLKLLGAGKVYAGDQYLQRIEDLFYPIIRVLRNEQSQRIDYHLENEFICIKTEDNETHLRMPAKDFLLEAEKLLKAIKAHNGAFALPEIEAFLNRLHCHTLKAKSNDKTDICIVLHDPRTRLNKDLGFSKKSQLGGNSTLLNASKATNFNYHILNSTLNQSYIESINNLNPSRNKVLERIKAIKAKGGVLEFDKVINDTFRNNLIMLDGDLPAILAHLLLLQVESGKSMLKDLVDLLNEQNPLHYDSIETFPFYAYKIKLLLTSTALGLMPAIAWNGLFDANGGYLVVKNDGEVLCYHFYDRNRFEDYLFPNAYLERASTSRHDYARIEMAENNQLSFRLNLQVRLT